MAKAEKSQTKTAAKPEETTDKVDASKTPDSNVAAKNTDIIDDIPVPAGKTDRRTAPFKDSDTVNVRNKNTGISTPMQGAAAKTLISTNSTDYEIVNNGK